LTISIDALNEAFDVIETQISELDFYGEINE